VTIPHHTPRAERIVTIHDIARTAGVSVQTVSRVMNNRPDVAPSTRERVGRAIDEAGFVPSVAARALSGGNRSIIGVITTARFSSGHFYPTVIEGCAAEAAAQNYALFVVPIDDEGTNARAGIDLLIGHRIAGVVVARPLPTYTPAFLATLRKITVPIMTTGNFRDPLGTILAIDMDNRAGARVLTQHLIDLGHRRFALIRGSSEQGGAEERVAGHLDALANADIPFNEIAVAEARWELASGAPALYDILSRGSDFTALVCHHDDTAIGAIRALSELGKRVPDDIAVVGFEDLPISAYLRPTLTTVRASAFDIGVASVRRLLGLLPSLPHPQLLPADLIIRESSGVPLAVREAHEKPEAMARSGAGLPM